MSELRQNINSDQISRRDLEMLSTSTESRSWLVNEDIHLIETIDIKPGGYSIIELHLKGSETPEEIKDLLRQELEGRFWWLRQYWKEKGQPTEAVEIICSTGAKVEMLNWHRPLTDQELIELRDVINLFATAYNGQAKSISYILIDNLPSHKTLSTGDPQNGNGTINGIRRDSYDGIQLYPAAFEGTHRAASDMSNFKGTVIHEGMHHIAKWHDPFLEDWAVKFGWLEDSEEAVAARNARCITEYAKDKVDEDICDSMVAKLGNNSALDSEKAQYLQERIIDQQLDNKLVSINRIPGSQAQQPRLPKQIYFKKVRAVTVKIAN